MGKPAPPVLGEGLYERRISLRPADVVLLRAHLEASEGLAAFFAEHGGEVMLATTEGLVGELDRFLADLAEEMPIWGPDAPRATTGG